MKTKEVIILFLLINISIAFSAELTLEPETINTKTGEEFTINIVLDNNENVYGLDFKLNNINGMELTNYEFLNRTNNSMTNVVQQSDYVRFGILFSPNTAGILPGEGNMIKLTYNASDALNEHLLFSNVFLSDDSGNSIQTATKGSNITIIQPTARLSCTNTYGYNGETITIQIHANRINTDIGGIDFYQNFDNKLRYITASKTTATNNAMLATNPESGRVRLGLVGTNITETTHILDVKYEIIENSGISILNFSDTTISDIDGNLLNTESNNNCEIEIEEINTPAGDSGSSGGGGISNSDSQNTATPAPVNAWDSHSSLLDGEDYDEPAFFTQTEPEEVEEKSGLTVIDEETTKKKTKGRSMPLAIITLTALIGLAVVVVFELKK